MLLSKLDKCSSFNFELQTIQQQSKHSFDHCGHSITTLSKVRIIQYLSFKALISGNFEAIVIRGSAAPKLHAS